MANEVWVYREMAQSAMEVPRAPEKLYSTGRVYVMRGDPTTGRSEVLGVFSSYEAAEKMAAIANEKA